MNPHPHTQTGQSLRDFLSNGSGEAGATYRDGSRRPPTDTATRRRSLRPNPHNYTPPRADR